MIDEIGRHNGVSTRFVSQFLGVSIPTARMELHRLAHNNLIKYGRLSGRGGQRDVWYPFTNSILS